jgi:hypothetical protein
MRILFLLLIMAGNLAWADDHYPGLQVDVKRDGHLYLFTASFGTSLSKCAAYRYLTDYEASRDMPGVVESLAYRESANQVKVDRTADERVLFFHVRIHSVMEYTEKPFDGLAFTQLSGDSRMFQGNWEIEPNQQGSTLKFTGLWEPDTLIPFFIIDHFAKNGLIDKFSAIAQLAEKRKDRMVASCTDQQTLTLGSGTGLQSVRAGLYQ